jgi:hypothetical protein
MKQLTSWTGCLLLLLAGAASCEKALQVYDEPDCRLNFEYLDQRGEPVLDPAFITPAMRESSYSFIYAGDAVTDTAWFTVTTMGILSDRDRPIALAQLVPGPGDTTTRAAVAGEHYVPFDSPDMAPHYKIPAGAARARIPVVMKRAPSLAGGDVTLRFTFKENAHFKPGYDHLVERSLRVSNRLAKLDNWEDTYADYYFGDYGPVKHKFLIDTSGNPWDEEYLEELMGGDAQYIDYLVNLYRLKLAELNEAREANGEGPLREADGTPVDFLEDDWY